MLNLGDRLAVYGAILGFIIAGKIINFLTGEEAGFIDKFDF